MLKAERLKSFGAPLVGAAVFAAIVALFYFINPFATGYGSQRVTIAWFINWILENGSDWKHCYLVPIAVIAIIYFRREQLALVPVKGSYLGLVVLLFALAVYWFGYRADNIYYGYASFQLLVAGCIFWLLGWQWMKALAFPWAFLVFLYPLPFLDNWVAFPLRMVMSEASVHVLNFIGVASVKIGSAIQSAPDATANLVTGQRFKVDVADPCSGIRSLFALMMVSALYGYFTLSGNWRKWVLFLSSMPLAVLGNLFRILMLTIGILVMGPDIAIGSIEKPSFFHELAGYIVFAVALTGMCLVGWALEADWPTLWQRWRTAARAPVPRPSAPSSKEHPSKHTDEY